MNKRFWETVFVIVIIGIGILVIMIAESGREDCDSKPSEVWFARNVYMVDENTIVVLKQLHTEGFLENSTSPDMYDIVYLSYEPGKGNSMIWYRDIDKIHVFVQPSCNGGTPKLLSLIVPKDFKFE